MKIKKYIFNDHYKKSSDAFRDILGLYFEYKNGNLYEKSFPSKDIYAQSFLEITEPELIDESLGLYKQKVQFKPKDTETNRKFLQSFYNEGFDIEGREDVLPESMQRNARTVDQAIKDTISDDTKKYQDLNCATNWVTEEQISSDEWFVKANSKYNFFIQKYENLIQQDILPEEVLPNFYVVTLSLNRNILDSISQNDYNSSLAIGSDSPYDNFYSKFDKFITLENNMFLNPLAQNTLLFGAVLIEYCKQYAEVYDNVSVDYIETAKKRFGQLFANITNKELLLKLNEFKNSYPMYTEIVWSTDSLGPLTQFLENAGISLQSFQDFINNQINIDIKDSPFETKKFTVIETRSNNSLYQTRTQDFQLYDIGRWISNFLDKMLNGFDAEDTSQNIIPYLDGPISVPTEDGEMLPPIYDNVEDILNAIIAQPKFNELLVNSSRRYDGIINGQLSESEILFYKIEKRDEYDELIQTFYIPNITGVDIQTYVDTQVKYNKLYVYKIFAFTVIYGTEYYYKKDVPYIFIPQIIEPILDLNQSNSTSETEEFAQQNNQEIEQPVDQMVLPVRSYFSTNPRSFSSNNSLPSAGGSAADTAVPNSIGNLADNVQSVNELTEEVQNIEPETAITLIYEDNFDEVFLEGYKFDVYYKPIIKLLEFEYTDRMRAKVLDFAPTPPVAHFYPIKDCSTRFNIGLAPSSGEIKQEPMPIYPEDQQVYDSYLDSVHLSDEGKIIFKYEGEINKYEMFRIENPPENYLSFSSDETLYKKTFTGFENFLFEEKIQSNKDYYYTFRAFDFHDKFSNPTSVFKVRIFENDGVEYLDVSIYEFPIPKKNLEIKFRKYLKIDTAFEQKEYSDLEEKLGLYNESVYDQEFVVKIRSKHTGKMIQLIIKFEKEDVI